jgi:hypothetical protein
MTGLADVAPIREIELPGHAAWSLEQSYHTTATSRCRLVALVGAPECGKTTLIASILHRFMKGPFAGYAFAGSGTLKGFDQRCFDARTASNRKAQHTERTPQTTKQPLLHLRFRAVGNEAPARDLLLLDVSGEDFRDALKSLSECARLQYLRSVDHFVVLLDGERLADMNERQLVQREALMLLQSCCDAKHLHQGSRVHLVVTKWDLILESPHRVDAESFVRGVLERLTEKFAQRVGEFKWFLTAPRPDDLAKYQLAMGLEDVLPAWIEDIGGSRPLDDSAAPSRPACEFDRLFYRGAAAEPSA